MKLENLEEASRVFKELIDLKRYEDFINHRKYSDKVNFVIKQHQGEACSKNAYKIQIDTRHNERLLDVVRDIIAELETKLKDLGAI